MIILKFIMYVVKLIVMTKTQAGSTTKNEKSFFIPFINMMHISLRIKAITWNVYEK